jgi:uncharacterized protein (DUF433 family)
MMAEPDLVLEMVGGYSYEYYPLGKFVVRAVGVCGGRPTFKYTRIDTGFILGRIACCEKLEDLVKDYNNLHLTAEAIEEAMALAEKGVEGVYVTEE